MKNKTSKTAETEALNKALVTSSGEDENLMEKRFAVVDNLIEAIVNDDMPIRAALLAATYLGQTKFQ